MSFRTLKSFAIALAISAPILSQAAPVTLNLNGNDTWAGWNNLTAAAHPGYGNFPGSSAWPQPIVSNLGTDSSSFNKINGAAYPAGGAIYSGGISAIPNTSGATFSILESTPIANLKTIVFQLEIGAGYGGYDLYNTTAPTLLINGNVFSLQTNFTTLLGQVQSEETFPVPGGGEEIVYINTWGFQWDLSTFVGQINSFEIQFTSVQHSQIYSMQLDQTDAIYSTAAVPEPSTYFLMLAAGATLLILRKKRAGLRST